MQKFNAKKKIKRKTKQFVVNTINTGNYISFKLLIKKMLDNFLSC